MGTLFTTVYNRFLGKITDDMYMELTPEDTIRDLRILLIDALPNFEFCRKNLLDYDLTTKIIPEEDVTKDDFVVGLLWNELNDGDTLPVRAVIEQSSFAAELTSEEINIIAILMMNGWLQRQLTSIENTRMKYSGTDFKFTSQANHMAKLQSLLAECQRQSHHFQRLYKRRELNEDNIYQSTWYWFGDHNVYN